MKYIWVILILMAGVIAMVLAVALVFLGLISLNQETTVNTPTHQSTTIPPRSTPPPIPSITTMQTPQNQDPIVGPWLNGMVFYPNGTVGSDGKTSWKENENENNSYFIISDSVAEWVYYPATDQISKRGSPEFISRGKPKPVPTTEPTLTTIQTQLPHIQTTINATPKKFSYPECVETCKQNYWADHHVGYYNDCLNTCNIENLKAAY